MRLIDADALLQEFERRQEQQISNYCECFLNDAHELSTEWNCVEDIVENAPNIEAEPVRHGKLEEYQIPHIICCSECDYGTCVDEKTKFCPNCGAKMDLEGE